MKIILAIAIICIMSCATKTQPYGGGTTDTVTTDTIQPAPVDTVEAGDSSLVTDTIQMKLK